MSTMLAIRVSHFGDAHALQPAQLPIPTPGPKQALVRLFAAGVNPVDTYIRSGSHAVKPTLPYTPGVDGAGEVIALGDGWARPEISVGARVWVSRTITGTYAQYAICDARNIALLPDALSFAHGAAVGVPYLTAWLALIPKAGLTATDTVLIHGGSGGVGLAAIQLARAAGATIIATAGTDEGLHRVIMEGADYAVNHRERGYEHKIMSLTNGAGPDVIIEMLANENLPRDCEMIAMRGRIVIVGSRDVVGINPRLLMTKDALMQGMSLMNAKDLEWALAMRAIRDGLANTTLRPIVHHTMPLSEARRAHDLIMDPQAGKAGKIILTIP